MKWETVIGLEVHAQLNTASKIFSSATTVYGAEPNTQANIVDLAMPGALPVLNEAAVRMAVKFGLSVGAVINLRSVFARKNYFYPDLPKGYQISQHDLPIIGAGKLAITLDDQSIKYIGITRAHLEEDAGKSLHENFHGMSGIDLNRAGIPLLEIVSEPDMRSAKEAIAYLKNLHELVRYIGICDGNMAEGSFRCDANVSVRLIGSTTFGTRCEIKNLNSFRFIERAIIYEASRQIAILEAGGTIRQETRLFDVEKNETRTLRSKENAHDYRYFPDPDLLPLKLTQAFIDAVQAELPELPEQKRQRFIAHYQLTAYDATILASSKELAHYFEIAVKQHNNPPQLTAHWITGELLAALNKHDFTIQQSPISAQQFSELLARIADQTISGKIAKTVFQAMWEGEGSADEIIARQGLTQMTDTHAIEEIVDKVIATYPAQLAEYRAGKEKVLAFFVGQVMKLSQGKANPTQVNTLLLKKLSVT